MMCSFSQIGFTSFVPSVTLCWRLDSATASCATVFARFCENMESNFEFCTFKRFPLGKYAETYFVAFRILFTVVVKVGQSRTVYFKFVQLACNQGEKRKKETEKSEKDMVTFSDFHMIISNTKDKEIYLEMIKKNTQPIHFVSKHTC
ncbi:hypothetical protein M8C21_024186, partial [Ambrosia artemisiifolia]